MPAMATFDAPGSWLSSCAPPLVVADGASIVVSADGNSIEVKDTVLIAVVLVARFVVTRRTSGKKRSRNLG